MKILFLFALFVIVSVISINDAFAQGEFISKFGTFGTGNGQFDQPWGIDVDSSGNIYVAEYWNHRIQKFDSSGNYITTFDNKGIYGYGCTNNPSNCNANGQFNQPMGISVDSSGDILVVDLGNQRIQKFDSNGNFIIKFGSYGTNDGEFYSPRDLAVDSSGNIWVADTNNNRIQKFDSSGKFLMKFGSYGQLTIQNDGTITSTDSLHGKFSNAASVAIDTLGNIYVADGNNRRIQKFDSSGNFLLQFGTYGTSDGKFISPNYVTTDNENRVYVSDRERHNVQIFDSNGNFITSIGTKGSSDGQFQDPKDIAVDSFGNIYVVDNNNRVQIFGSLAVTPPPDKIPPVVVVPNNMAIQATSNNPSPVTFSVSATDDKDGPITPTCSPKSGTDFVIGKTVVTCIATDKAGNTATKSFTVTVLDATGPEDCTSNQVWQNNQCVDATKPPKNDLNLQTDLDLYGQGDVVVISGKVNLQNVQNPPQQLVIENPRLVNAFGSKISNNINVNQQVQISADVKNNQEKSQKLVYVVQVKNQNGVVVSLGWISGSLNPGQTFSPAISWTPTVSTVYTEIFVWDVSGEGSNKSWQRLNSLTNHLTLSISSNGHVSPSSNSVSASNGIRDVAIIVRSPDNNIVTISQVPLNSDGSFQTSLKADGPQFIAAGDYTVLANFAGLKSQTTFEFTGGTGTIVSDGNLQPTTCPSGQNLINGKCVVKPTPIPDPATEDTDKDGIPDSTDKCPTQKETVNGYQDTDGCPDVDAKKVDDAKKLADKKVADAKKALDAKKAEKIKLAKEKAKERAKEKAKANAEKKSK